MRKCAAARSEHRQEQCRHPRVPTKREHLPEQPSPRPGVLRLPARAQRQMGRSPDLRWWHPSGRKVRAQGQDRPPILGTPQSVGVHPGLDQFPALPPFGQLRGRSCRLDGSHQGRAGSGIHHGPVRHLPEQLAPTALQQQRQWRPADPPFQPDDRHRIRVYPVIQRAADQQTPTLHRPSP